MQDLSQMLSAITPNNPRASEEILPLVYEELRRLAQAKLSREKPGQTLQATDLVHEAYLRVTEGARPRPGIARGISSPPPPRR